MAKNYRVVAERDGVVWSDDMMDLSDQIVELQSRRGYEHLTDDRAAQLAGFLICGPDYDADENERNRWQVTVTPS